MVMNERQKYLPRARKINRQEKDKRTTEMTNGQKNYQGTAKEKDKRTAREMNRQQKDERTVKMMNGRQKDERIHRHNHEQQRDIHTCTPSFPLVIKSSNGSRDNFHIKSHC